ncbi:hypothetical protein ACOSP7_022283 [Xanthoceras sorbifolium]
MEKKSSLLEGGGGGSLLMRTKGSSSNEVVVGGLVIPTNVIGEDLKKTTRNQTEKKSAKTNKTFDVLCHR